MIDSYLTVLSGASDEIVVQKSRFIGFAFPCKTESEALCCIKKLKDQYHDATHHCYAYIIGENSGIMRYSDDGEPGGTAGLPIINVLRSKGVVDCCIVVVRYFGGTKLGTGGLARAYTQGCQIALRAAKLVRMEKTLVQFCRVPYSCWDSIQRLLPRIPARIDSVSFGASTSVESATAAPALSACVCLPRHAVSIIKAKIIKILFLIFLSSFEAAKVKKISKLETSLSELQNALAKPYEYQTLTAQS